MKSHRIGGKIRRFRQEKRLNQAQMAQELGISASYLNLIESNQRPVTVAVLLKLAEKFHIDLSLLNTEGDERLHHDVMEALSDPFFEPLDLKASDARELVAQLPSMGQAFVALYQAYRRNAGVEEGSEEWRSEATSHTLPSEEVTDFLQIRGNYFPELEELADHLWVENGLSLFSLQRDLVEVLNTRYAVDFEIVSAQTMPGILRRYNPMTRRLHLSELLSPSSRTFQIAHQIAFLGFRRDLEGLVSGGRFTSPEADKLAASALANYFAAAVMAPYSRFLHAARETRHDLTILQRRFGMSFEQICHRLTTLRGPSAEGLPFHLIRVDSAGNISKRFSASGIPIARFSAACPRWNIYDAFATPGMLRVQIAQMPDGARYFCLARTVMPAGRSGLSSPFLQRAGMVSLGIGTKITHAKDIVYADGLNLDDPHIITQIGVSCRSCLRSDCQDRAMPAFEQRLTIDENKRGLSTYMSSNE